MLESGLSPSRKRIVLEDTRADRARDCIGKGPGGEQQVRTQENCSAIWLLVV